MVPQGYAVKGHAVGALERTLRVDWPPVVQDQHELMVSRILSQKQHLPSTESL